MKTKNLFKSIATVALCTVFSMGAYAQLTTNHLTTVDEDAANEGTDYVCVGARVPYQVSGDLNIWNLNALGVMETSVYQWATTGGTPYRINGTTALAGTEVTTKGVEDITGLGFYNDTIISIDFPAAGTFTVSVAERSVSNTTGITGCLGNTEDLSVQVVAIPTIAYNDADRIMGGCGADILADNNIPVTVSGSNTLRVTYRIDRTDLTGASSAIVATGTTMTDGDNADFTTGWGILAVGQAATNIEIPYAIVDGEYGVYTVTLEAVTDRIARKSLNSVAGYDTDGLPAVVAQRTLTIYALPTPVTGKIRHVTNLTW